MTDRADINSVLSEIRSMRAQMMQSQRITQDQTQNLDSVASPRDAVAPSFNDMFSQAVNGVNSLQKESSQLATAYEQGDPSVDITRVMIASQKSSVAFEAMTQVRNRVVRAYEDIMNMPV